MGGRTGKYIESLFHDAASFQFTKEDITNLRLEMKTLVLRLSKMYLGLVKPSEHEESDSSQTCYATKEKSDNIQIKIVTEDQINKRIEILKTRIENVTDESDNTQTEIVMEESAINIIETLVKAIDNTQIEILTEESNTQKIEHVTDESDNTQTEIVMAESDITQIETEIVMAESDITQIETLTKAIDNTQIVNLRVESNKTKIEHVIDNVAQETDIIQIDILKGKLGENLISPCLPPVDSNGKSVMEVRKGPDISEEEDDINSIYPRLALVQEQSKRLMALFEKGKSSSETQGDEIQTANKANQIPIMQQDIQPADLFQENTQNDSSIHQPDALTLLGSLKTQDIVSITNQSTGVKQFPIIPAVVSRYKMSKMFWLRYTKEGNFFTVNISEDGTNEINDVDVDFDEYDWLCANFTKETVEKAMIEACDLENMGLDVSAYNKEIGTSNQQLQRMHYVFTTKDAVTGKRIEMMDVKDHYFMGCELDLRTKKEIWQGKLTTAWVVKSFETKYLQQLREQSFNDRTKIPRWINVPACAQRGIKLNPEQCIPQYPPIVFKQKEHERNCLSVSFANALHYLKIQQSLTLYDLVKYPDDAPKDCFLNADYPG